MTPNSSEASPQNGKKTSGAARTPVALTIGGSDSGAGAGIQADLKTFAAFGVYGTSAITALTAQNTMGVRGIHVVGDEFVAQQIEAVVTDIGCDAVKTGMLPNAQIVEAVAAAVESLDLPNLVIDPVMIAKSGDRLIDDEAAHALRWTLLRLARVVTPNIPEAEVLARMPVRSVADMHEAARRIATLKPRAVIVKGGHMDGPDVIDVLWEDGKIHEFTSRRVQGRNTHGTGCTFASAIAAQLAKGIALTEAIREAKTYVAGAMQPGIPLGEGHRPLNHFWKLY